jgi:hypothetical protein
MSESTTGEGAAWLTLQALITAASASTLKNNTLFPLSRFICFVFIAPPKSKLACTYKI